MTNTDAKRGGTRAAEPGHVYSREAVREGRVRLGPHMRWAEELPDGSLRAASADENPSRGIDNMRALVQQHHGRTRRRPIRTRPRTPGAGRPAARRTRTASRDGLLPLGAADREVFRRKSLSERRR